MPRPRKLKPVGAPGEEPLQGPPTDEGTAPGPLPQVSILERRLADPHARPSAAIRLKTPGWVCRWVNTDISDNHAWHVKYDKGWTEVSREEVQGIEDWSGLYESPDGIVRRGVRGQEVLMKMPLDWYERIQHAKEERNRKSDLTLKQRAAEAAGAQFGDLAAETVAGARLTGELIHGKTREEFDG